MAHYKFPLQRLLDIRKDKEDESKRNFMEAQRQKRMAEEKLEKLKHDYKKYNVEKTEDDIAKRRVKENYLTYLKKQIVTSSEELEKCIEIVEEKRLDLAQKQIDRKTVETLKDKRLELFNKEQDDIERKANDEFALYSYMRKIEGR